MTTFIDRAVKKFGPPSGGIVAKPELIASYSGRLPSGLLEFWKEYGIGQWLEGYFQFCDPSRYAPIVESVFEGDTDFEPDRTHVFGMSAFGKLLAWSEDHKVIDINVLTGIVDATDFFDPLPNSDPNTDIGVTISGVDSDAYDSVDEDGNDLFKRALSKYGRLEFGQLYAPRLHPVLGGALVLDNFRPASALEALAIGAQSTTFQLRDLSSMTPRIVRKI